MDAFLPLAGLKKGVCDEKICVKVLSLWFEKRYGLGSYCNMILADSSGKKIEAYIPENYYVKEYAERIIEGKWFIISGFDVGDPVKAIRNNNHVYQIIFSCKTWFLPFDNLSDSCFFEFQDSYADLLEGQICKEFPIDLYGVVKKFWNPERIPYVPRDDEQDYKCMAVRFELVDHEGNFVKCCAIGDCCLNFMTQWREGEYDLNFIERPKVFCVLQFWRICELGGEISVINGIGCSKILLNPELAELEEIKFVSFFTEGFYKVEKEKEEIQWFEYYSF